MVRAQVEFINFDSSDVIATSGGIRYGFQNGYLYRYSAKDVVDYKVQPYDVRGSATEPRSLNATDEAVYKFWVKIYGDTTIGGETFNPGDNWENVTKWLFLNNNADPENLTADDWWLVNRSGQ